LNIRSRDGDARVSDKTNVASGMASNAMGEKRGDLTAAPNPLTPTKLAEMQMLPRRADGRKRLETPVKITKKKLGGRGRTNGGGGRGGVVWGGGFDQPYKIILNGIKRIEDKESCTMG